MPGNVSPKQSYTRNIENIPVNPPSPTLNSFLLIGEEAVYMPIMLIMPLLA